MLTLPAQSLTKDTLRLQARDLLRSQLLRGEYGEGRLNESELAGRIGISRTPLREALRGLEEEGLLFSVANQGFYVKPLAVEEVREIYPVLWELEALALRLSPRVRPEQLRRLEALNGSLAEAVTDPAQALALDTHWHAELLRGCPNQRLLDIIRNLKTAAYRYEFAYMRQANRVLVSTAQHNAILGALRNQDLERATKGLEANWRVTLDATEQWLARRPR